MIYNAHVITYWALLHWHAERNRQWMAAFTYSQLHHIELRAAGLIPFQSQRSVAN